MSLLHRSMLGALLLAVALTVGCKKQQPAAANTAADPSAAPASTRGPGLVLSPGAASVIADSGDVTATLNQLSLELRRYVVRTRSVPKSFEEFAAKSGVQAPPPPAGKKYSIQDQIIVLVKL